MTNNIKNGGKNMIVTRGYQKPLMERIENIEENSYATYTILGSEKLKVYYSFAHQFIGNILNETTIVRWKPGGYIIESQTGSGKSTLVIKTLIPMAQNQGKHVAIIVPRIALALQYKKELAQEYEPELLESLTDAGHNQHRAYGNVDVFTMQEFTNYGVRNEFIKKCTTYEYIILDEIHAFVGDSSFNPYTHDILKFLVTSSEFAKRIYLTATLDIIIQDIVDMEKHVFPNKCGNYVNHHLRTNENVVLYRFRYDYSFLTLVLFSQENSGIETLKQTQEGEKTLIFVHSKAKGLKLRDSLGADKAVFIDAERKMLSEADTFHYIVSNGEFDKQFLIVTKFLDVGVNLLDKSIRRVFVFHQYKEEVVQMLGRRRISKTDNVTLYLYVPQQNNILKQLDVLKNEYQSMIRDWNVYKNMAGGCFNQLPPSLYAEKKDDKWEIKSNYYAHRLNLYHQEQLKRLIGCQTDSDYYEHYAQIILHWFPHYKEVKWLDRVRKSDIHDKVTEILDPIVGHEFEKDKATDIANDILRIFNIPRRKEQENSMPIILLKKLFSEENISYVFRNLSRNGKKGLYIVERGVDWS